MKGDVKFDPFLMLWFQNDSLDTVGLGLLELLGGDPGIWWIKMTFGVLNVLRERGGH